MYSCLNNFRFEQDHLEKDLLPTEHVALSRIRGVLLESTSVDDRSARTYYAERVHHLLGGSSSSSTATKKARRCDDQESLESCLNCGKLGVPFDLSNPFVSACTHCNSLHDRCCLTLRLVSFDLPVLRCQMCSSVCLPDQSESQIFCDLWTTSGSGSMCPFCLVLMDSILC